jgi:hypothetical protein
MDGKYCSWKSIAVGSETYLREIVSKTKKRKRLHIAAAEDGDWCVRECRPHVCKMLKYIKNRRKMNPSPNKTYPTRLKFNYFKNKRGPTRMSAFRTFRIFVRIFHFLPFSQCASLLCSRLSIRHSYCLAL